MIMSLIIIVFCYKNCIVLCSNVTYYFNNVDVTFFFETTKNINSCYEWISICFFKINNNIHVHLKFRKKILTLKIFNLF